MSLSLASRVYRTFVRLTVTTTIVSLMTLHVAGQQSDAAKGEAKMNVVAKIEWSKLSEANELCANTSTDQIAGESVLKVVRDTNTSQLIPLVTIKEPKLKEKAYALRGKVRIESVEGDGFLEMWNHFPEPKPGTYFTRTNSESGAMGKLRGTAPWREFVLPFRIDDKTHPNPIKLQVNVFLPGKGTIWLTDLILEEMPLDQLQSRLQGSDGSLPSWFWGMIALAILVPIAIVTIAFRALASKAIHTGKAEQEIRRMKALDLN